MLRKTTGILAGAVLAALISGAAYPAVQVGQDTLLGESVSAESMIDKVVRIDAGTRWVNAVQNETVKFIVGGTTFAWRFPSERFAVNLKDIAPAGTVDRDIYVYLAPDSRYSSGD